MSDIIWHYADGGVTRGPVSHADLCAMFAGRELPIETPVRHGGMADWAEASTVDDFRGIWGKGFSPRPMSSPPPMPASPLEPPIAPTADEPSSSRPGFEHRSGVRPEDKRWQEEPQVRPWIRFWARNIDNSLLLLVCLSVFPTLGPYNLMLYAMLVAGALFIYPLQLWIFGATIGKAIFGISVETDAGERPSFGQAGSREIGVYLNGMGLGLPLVNLLTSLSAYKRLTLDGATSWDRSNGLFVRHRGVGFFRWATFAAVLVATMYATFVTVATANGKAAPSLSFGSAGRATATVQALVPTTQPTAAKKPKGKPKLLSLPTEKVDNQPAVRPNSATARPAKRPPPKVIFKPEAPPTPS